MVTKTFTKTICKGQRIIHIKIYIKQFFIVHTQQTSM